ncbi:hypothetical protein AMECASPLE_025275 [Ameca splendens]|uniref:Uncharacterized protein n=1 Tax=Ameca splendens TaxID=208324 RepID=A0ABV1A0F0_9TELE
MLMSMLPYESKHCRNSVNFLYLIAPKGNSSPGGVGGMSTCSLIKFDTTDVSLQVCGGPPCHSVIVCMRVCVSVVNLCVRCVCTHICRFHLGVCRPPDVHSGLHLFSHLIGNEHLLIVPQSCGASQRTEVELFTAY